MTETLGPTRDIVVDEFFPHAPATVWKALTSATMMAKWLMPPEGFAAVVGQAFTFRTTPAGAWDGVIHCQVTEVDPEHRLTYSWKGGHADNTGYGAPLDTTVTWTLTPAEGGTMVRMAHAGFVTPRNDTALKNMGDGWKKVVPQLRDLAGT